MEKLILVIYLDVAEMAPAIAREIMNNWDAIIKRRIENEDIISFVVPAKETKVECLNPRLVTEEEYVKAKETLEKIEKLIK